MEMFVLLLMAKQYLSTLSFLEVLKILKTTAQGISHKYCNLLQRTDGYEYA